MTPAEASAVRKLADRADQLGQLCKLVAETLWAFPEQAGRGEAVEGLGWMATNISENLLCLADDDATAAQATAS